MSLRGSGVKKKKKKKRLGVGREWELLCSSQLPHLCLSCLRPRSAAFSSQQAWVASGATDGSVRIWDLTSGSVRSSMTADGGAIKVSWVPEAPNVLAVATSQGSVQLWDSRDGSVRQSLTGHAGMVLDIAFVPGGELVTAGDDGTAKIFALSLA